MPEIFRRLYYLLHRSRLERELAEDMEFHREMAAREGRTNFGNTLLLREQARDVWAWTWIDRLAQDLRYAFRVLRKSPGFTLAAVLMLAIGTGVNIAAFGFFDLMVLRPLNVRDPGSLLRFHRRSPVNYAFALPYPEMDFFRENSRTLASVLAVNTTRLSIRGEEKQSEIQFVTANYFRELGARPLLGRTLDPATEDSASAPPVVVLSEGFWRRYFGGDTAVIGKTLYLNEKPATIIGVLPEDFSGLSTSVPPVWASLAQHPYFVKGSRLLTDWSVESSGVQMFGRLQPGLNPKAAEAELAGLAAELRRQHPNDVWEHEGLRSQPGGYVTSLLNAERRGSGAEDSGELYRILGLIGAFSLLILAVTCANLGSLLLARGVAREREMSIRAAVGAGSARLLRQLLTECVVLALLGSAVGLVLGYAILRELMAISEAPRWLNPAPDWRVAVFAIGIAFLAVALFGVAPAMQTARRRHRTRSRQFLVGCQVAASCILVIVASLLGRALTHATSEGPGYEYRHVVSIDPGLDQHGYSPARARNYLDTLQTRLRAMPGVESVSLALTPPLGHRSATVGLTIDDRSVNIEMHRVDPEFFRTIELPLLRGRNLLPREEHSILVSDSLARAMWPGKDPLGRKLAMGEEYTVVGVVRSARLTRLQDSDSVQAYLPIDAGNLPAACVVVRTAQNPEDAVRALIATSKSVAADAFPEVQLLSAAFSRKIEGARYTALTVSVLGGIADLLACLGIVGVIAYTVSQRTREIGIRMALGGRPSHVMKTVLRQLLVPVPAGLILGIGGAVVLSRYLRQILFGISSLDPASYAFAIGVFLITIAGAAILPARKAIRIDPLRALRQD